MLSSSVHQVVKVHPQRQGQARQHAGSAAALAERALAFDPTRYRHHLAHLNMSEEAKLELLAVVWRILESAVDRAWGDDAAQLARIAGDSRKALRAGSGADAVCSTPDHNMNVGQEHTDSRMLGERD